MSKILDCLRPHWKNRIDTYLKRKQKTADEGQKDMDINELLI